jgi:protein import protein ZIM17
MFTKRSYHHGIVLIRCEGCEGIHLIADNLGWFEDSSVNIEEILQRNGEKYKKLSAEGLFQMSTQDVSSSQIMEETVEEKPKH